MSILIPAIHIDGKWFLFAIITSLLVAVIRRSLSKFIVNINVVVLTVIIIIGFFRAYQDSQQTRRPEAIANYQAQLWARNNTEEEALFLVLPEDIFWRVISNRKVLYGDVYSRTPGYFYSFSRKTKEFEDNIKAFLKELKGTKEHYDESDILIIAKRFNVDYVVENKDNILNFDQVYKNSHQIIYELPAVN